jgi:hypothetical protein
MRSADIILRVLKRDIKFEHDRNEDCIKWIDEQKKSTDYYEGRRDALVYVLALIEGTEVTNCMVNSLFEGGDNAD